MMNKIKQIPNYLIRFILVFAILGLYFIGPTTIKAASNASTLRELRQELAALKAKRNANANKKRLTQSEINAKNAAIDNAYAEIQKSERAIEAAKALIKETNKKIEEIKEQNEKLMRYFQMLQGDNIYLEFITDSSSMTELIMRSDAVKQLADYQQAKLLEMDALIEKNEKLQVDLKKNEEKLEKNIKVYQSTIVDLQDNLSDLNEIGMDIDDEIRSQEELIKAYEQMGCKEDEDLNVCSQVSGNVKWLKPLKKGRVNSIFGVRRNPLGGGYKVHKAVDIGGNAEGTTVYSAGNGVVIATVDATSKGYKTCGGNQVYIQLIVAGETYVVQYAHLLKVYVKVGDKVSGSSVIGLQGGGPGTSRWERCSTGTHLHFGVAKGKPSSGASVSSFVSSHAIKPPGYPSKGSWFYARDQYFG